MGGRKDKAECMQFSMGQLYYWFKLQWSRSSVGRVLSLNDWPQLSCCVTALPVSLSLSLSPSSLAEGRKIDISSPVDFEHTVHVGFDPSTGKFTVSSSLGAPLWGTVKCQAPLLCSHLCIFA